MQMAAFLPILNLTGSGIFLLFLAEFGESALPEVRPIRLC